VSLVNGKDVRAQTSGPLVHGVCARAREGLAATASTYTDDWPLTPDTLPWMVPAKPRAESGDARVLREQCDYRISCVNR